MAKKSDVSKVMICGGGKIGQMVAQLLSDCGDYAVTVVDKDKKQFSKFKKMKNVATEIVDLSNQKAIEKVAKKHDFLISTAPFFLTEIIAGAGAEHNDALGRSRTYGILPETKR